MIRETLPASQQRAFPLLFWCHLGAVIALDGSPDDEAMERTLIAGRVTGALIDSELP